MDVSHNFRFRWNDHVPHLSQIFSELRFDEVYCDTTIISDDGFVLKAHGAVLSATSRYFEHVLSDVTADQHPIIVLKGANFTELSCLLDYIYEGVTQVDQHLMESVLDVADMLEIKGLSKMKNNLSIKKLIAPSSSSSVVSRSSLQSSSPSKSPMPPSHTSQTHSPSCPSSPNESYVPSSAMLKMDNDDQNEVVDPSQKKRHLFHEGKTPLNTSIVESKDYSSTVVTSNVPSHIPVCQTSDYSDQTLGIDLSLSRPTNEEIERTSAKNCSLQEDTPLRKRKIMKYEEFSPPSTDIEWGKTGEKVKDSVLHKKSCFFTRSDDDLQMEPRRGSHSFSSSTEFLPYELTRRSKGVPSSHLEDSSIWRHIKEKVLAKRLEDSDQGDDDTEFSVYEDYLQFDSDAESEGGTLASKESSLPLSGSSLLGHHEAFVKQEPSTAAGVYGSCSYMTTERSNRSPAYNLSREPRSEGPEERREDVWSFPGIVNVGSRTKRRPLEAPLKVPQTESSVTDFVSVKLCQMNNPTASEGAQHQPLVQEALREIDTRLRKPTPQIKRPLSKYTLFIKEMYPVIARQYSTNKAKDILRIISSVWRNMTEEEKRPWEVKANELLQDFKRRHPDYVFCPRVLQVQKQEYYIKKAERRNMFRINPYPHVS